MSTDTPEGSPTEMAEIWLSNDPNLYSLTWEVVNDRSRGQDAADAIRSGVEWMVVHALNDGEGDCCADIPGLPGAIIGAWFDAVDWEIVAGHFEDLRPTEEAPPAVAAARQERDAFWKEIDAEIAERRDPVEVYGTPEHEAWLMQMEARGDYQ